MNHIPSQSCALKTALLLCLGFTLSGCGQKHKEIVEPYVSDYTQIRAKLKRIAELIPPPGSTLDSEPQTLDPPFKLLDEETGDNAEALMFEQLNDPEIKNLPFDLLLSDNLLVSLNWTSDERKDDDSKGGDADFMRSTMAAGRQLRYLVVHRVVKLTLPEAVGPQEFTPGSVTLEGFVVDLKDEKVVATYVVTAETPANVKFVYKEGDSPNDRLQAFAKSEVFTDARSQIAKKLEQVTGGDVRID